MRLRAFWLFGLAASRRSCGSAFRTKCALLDEDNLSGTGDGRVLTGCMIPYSESATGTPVICGRFGLRFSRHQL